MHDTEYQEKIRITINPKQVKSLGRSRKLPICADWEEVKEAILYQAGLEKVSDS